MGKVKKPSQEFWWCKVGGHYTNYKGICFRHKIGPREPALLYAALVVYPSYPILVRTLKKTVGYNYRMYTRFPKKSAISYSSRDTFHNVSGTDSSADSEEHAVHAVSDSSRRTIASETNRIMPGSKVSSK